MGWGVFRKCGTELGLLITLRELSTIIKRQDLPKINGITMTLEKFQTIICKDIALVDFSLGWCAPCRIQEKIIRSLKNRFTDQAAVAIMDLDADRKLAADFFIQSVPTVILFQNGKEVQRFVGLQSEETLQSAIQSVLNKQKSKRQRDA